MELDPNGGGIKGIIFYQFVPFPWSKEDEVVAIGHGAFLWMDLRSDSCLK